MHSRPFSGRFARAAETAAEAVAQEGVHGLGIDEGVPLTEKTKRLSELKAMASDHSAKEGGVQVKEYVYGKYVVAISVEHGIPAQNIDRSIRPADYPVDEQHLNRELHLGPLKDRLSRPLSWDTFRAMGLPPRSNLPLARWKGWSRWKGNGGRMGISKIDRVL
ncbi:hypothetical protein BC936DRAFT_142401 [Jimgerdemannia flammicorona]|uniref:Uncharacterized protein n=1 Tax=Jimgerdemannia flammicorona TaxID=994334 RepID=A0A433A0G2_9FUNG|nr:hypothetical protein BC936DRAFT_142401 [Jimgerdemannia flammicorona]